MLTLGCLLLGWKFVETNMATNNNHQLSLTDTEKAAEAGQVKSVVINGVEVTGKYADQSKGTFTTTIPQNDPDLYKDLKDHGVDVTMKDPQGNMWVQGLISFLPFVVLFGFILFMMRQMQSGGNKAMSFGKNRARLLSMQQKKITFKDVAGVDEAKEELKEIIEFLREAQKFQRLGGRIPKGVLMVGPPERVRLCWRVLSPVRRTCRSSRSPVPTSWRCLSASAQAACATCLSKVRRMLPASSLSTRLTLSVVTAEQVSAADTMSVSRH